MLKRILSALSALCLLALLPAFACAWETPIDPMLMTGRFSAWDADSCSIGILDYNGVLWRYDGPIDYERDWLFTLWRLAGQGKLVQVSKLSYIEMFDLEGLVYSVDPDAVVSSNDYVDDADAVVRYAFRTYIINDDDIISDDDFVDEIILLGEAVDTMQENTSPAAQALYKKLDTLFPDIEYPEPISPEFAPTGFQPVPLYEFCGMKGFEVYETSLCLPRITVYESDCEIGLIEVEFSGEDYEGYLDLALHGMVTGMANASMVTGGTTIIVYETADGDRIGSIELYHGLVCMSDGMYEIAIP